MFRGGSTSISLLPTVIFAIIWAVFGAITAREEPVIVTLYNPVLLLICSMSCVFLYGNGVEGFEFFVQLFSLVHTHPTNLAVRVTLAFFTFFCSLALLTLGASNETHGGFTFHTKCWKLKIIYLCVLLMAWFVPSESFIINFGETLVQAGAIVFIGFIAFQFYRLTSKGSIISSSAERWDYTTDIGSESTSPLKAMYTFHSAFVAVCFVFFLVGAALIAHIIIVVEIAHECRISIAAVSIALFAYVVGFAACVIGLYRRRQLERSHLHGLTPFANVSTAMCQSFSTFFIISYFLWRVSVADDPLECTGTLFLGEWMYSVMIILAFCVSVVALVTSTLNEETVASHKTEYSFWVYNLFVGFACCYMCTIICRWTDVTYEMDGYSEERDVDIGWKAVIADTIALALCVGLYWFHLLKMYIIGANYAEVELEQKKLSKIIDDDDSDDFVDV